MSEPSHVSRRTALQSALAGGGMAALALAAAGAEPKPDDRRASPKRYDMKKSINLWAFPYPQRMTLRECLQQFVRNAAGAGDLRFRLGLELRDRREGRIPRTSPVAQHLGLLHELAEPGARHQPGRFRHHGKRRGRPHLRR